MIYGTVQDENGSEWSDFQLKGNEYATSLKQMISDWQYIEENYEPAYDFCGGFCEEDKLRGLLLGQYSKQDVIYELLEYYFTKYQARKQLDFSDKRILRIQERYGFEYEYYKTN